MKNYILSFLARCTRLNICSYLKSVNYVKDRVPGAPPTMSHPKIYHDLNRVNPTCPGLFWAGETHGGGGGQYVPPSLDSYRNVLLT